MQKGRIEHRHLETHRWGRKSVILGIILRDFLGIILRVRADGWSYPGASEASKILKNRQQRRMRIGELARTVDVNVETIRYYQRIGLVELPEKPYGSMRSYSDQDLQRLRFIRVPNSSDFRSRTSGSFWSFRALTASGLKSLPLRS